MFCVLHEGELAYNEVIKRDRGAHTMKHTYEGLMRQLFAMELDPNGTMLIHSSMKSIGDVEGGADTVLDCWASFMEEGLLVLPTHTWRTIKADNPKFYVEETPSCVGLLTEMFRKREGVVRSWHPTHSVGALGREAAAFTAGDERWDTPCARGSAWGKLLDRKATILMVGADIRRCTYIHGIEEWVDVPGRLTDHHEQLYTVSGDGMEISVPSRRHCGLDWSEHFGKTEPLLLREGAIRMGQFGDAEVRICNAARMMEVLEPVLKKYPKLFSNLDPMPEELR